MILGVDPIGLVVENSLSLSTGSSGFDFGWLCLICCLIGCLGLWLVVKSMSCRLCLSGSLGCGQVHVGCQRGALG